MANDWTFWLQVMNLALVAVTLLAALVVTGAVGWELWARRERKAHAADCLDAELWAMSRADLHTLSVPGLGLTISSMVPRNLVQDPSSCGPVQGVAAPRFPRRARLAEKVAHQRKTACLQCRKPAGFAATESLRAPIRPPRARRRHAWSTRKYLQAACRRSRSIPEFDRAFRWVRWYPLE